MAGKEIQTIWNEAAGEGSPWRWQRLGPEMREALRDFYHTTRAELVLAILRRKARDAREDMGSTT